MSLPEWKSQIFPGKIRAILSWPSSGLLVVASREQVMLWNLQTKTQVYVLDLAFNLLDIKIAQLQAQSSAFGLYVLGSNGLVFIYALQNDTITCVGKIRLLRTNEDDVAYGSLSVEGNFIASTFGKNVVVRNSDAKDKRVITAKHGYIFQGIHSRKKITHLLFLSPNRLMILSYEAGLLVTFDLKLEMRCQVLRLPFHPSSATFSRKNDVIVFHDPFGGTYFYNATELKPVNSILGGTTTTATLALPAYLTFTEDEQAVGIASNNGKFCFLQ
ncbi:hypothetical protein CPB83DRAFT_893053 [Crepidotus variabilis]|uniref:Uncharacterized protein n=1 Tax=Crepidotus variabilis TaxID=179855 RepID=A0A9P6JRU4_9AGAR|nr:hypothetical protein CPB83DRAFT_893053 [Crepidotus variabilis]